MVHLVVEMTVEANSLDEAKALAREDLRSGLCFANLIDADIVDVQARVWPSQKAN
jgi:hypothetical protein